MEQYSDYVKRWSYCQRCGCKRPADRLLTVMVDGSKKRLCRNCVDDLYYTPQPAGGEQRG